MQAHQPLRTAGGGALRLTTAPALGTLRAGGADPCGLSAAVGRDHPHQRHARPHQRLSVQVKRHL